MIYCNPFAFCKNGFSGIMEKKIICIDDNIGDVKIETFSALWDDHRKEIILYDGITNGFYALNIETGVLHILGRLYEELSQWGHFARPIRLEEGGYCFPPCNRENMVIINGENNMKEIPVKFDKGKTWRITNALEYEGQIVLLCGAANGIILIDKENGNEKVFDKWLTEYRSKAGKDIFKRGKKRFKSRYGNYLLEDKRLTVPLLWTSSLLTLDLRTRKYSFCDVDVLNANGFVAIYSINSSKWLLSKVSNQVVEMDQNGDIKAHQCGLSGDTFGRSVSIGKKILILGMHTYQFAVYDTISKDSEIYDIIPSDTISRTAAEANFSVLLTISETHIMAFDVSTRCFFGIKTDDEWNSIHVENMALYWDDETRIRLLKEGCGTQNPVIEGGNWKLRHFINVIQKIKND